MTASTLIPILLPTRTLSSGNGGAGRRRGSQNRIASVSHVRRRISGQLQAASEELRSRALCALLGRAEQIHALGRVRAGRDQARRSARALRRSASRPLRGVRLRHQSSRRPDLHPELDDHIQASRWPCVPSTQRVRAPVHGFSVRGQSTARAGAHRDARVDSPALHRRRRTDLRVRLQEPAY